MMIIIEKWLNEWMNDFRLGNFDSDIVHHHHHRIIESSNHLRLMIYWLFRKKISIINKTRVQNIFANKKDPLFSFFLFTIHSQKLFFLGFINQKFHSLMMVAFTIIDYGFLSIFYLFSSFPPSFLCLYLSLMMNISCHSDVKEMMMMMNKKKITIKIFGEWMNEWINESIMEFNQQKKTKFHI